MKYRRNTRFAMRVKGDKKSITPAVKCIKDLHGGVDFYDIDSDEVVRYVSLKSCPYFRLLSSGDNENVIMTPKRLEKSAHDLVVYLLAENIEGAVIEKPHGISTLDKKRTIRPDITITGGVIEVINTHGLDIETEMVYDYLDVKVMVIDIKALKYTLEELRGKIISGDTNGLFEYLNKELKQKPKRKDRLLKLESDVMNQKNEFNELVSKGIVDRKPHDKFQLWALTTKNLRESHIADLNKIGRPVSCIDFQVTPKKGMKILKVYCDDIELGVLWVNKKG